MPLGDYEYTKQYISWLIHKEMKKHGVKGLSVALVDDQKVVWAEGFGFADAANEIPATPETVYRVGSISKLFTVAAVMQLAEQGRIDIDRPLKDYLPEFSMKSRFSNAAPITPRTIMTHHSGLPTLWLKGAFTEEPFVNVVNEIQDEQRLFPPNFVFFYSNLGFNLLGTMLERVSGIDFDSYLEDRVFRPLRMEHSSFVLRADMEAHLSKGYAKSKEAKPWPIRDLPAGSLYSNVVDLSRFMQMVFAKGSSENQDVLKPETVAEMLRVQNGDVALDFDLKIGLAWFLNDYGIRGAGPVASHGGGTPLFISQLTILPEHQLGIIVLANSASAHPMVEKVATHALKLALEAKTGITQPDAAESRTASPTSVSQQVGGSYEGKYLTPAGMVSVASKRGRLKARVMGKTVYLVPQGDGWFEIKYKLLGLFPMSWKGRSISFATVSGREVLALRYKSGFTFLAGEKIKPRPIPEVWLDRLGAYEVVNPDEYPGIEKLHLRHEDGLLLLEGSVSHLSGKEEILKVLSPISDTEALNLTLGRGQGMGSIQMVSVNGEVRLRYSGYEFRRISK